MNDSKRWLLMKLVLGQADVVLRRMHTAMNRQPDGKNSLPPLQIEAINKDDLENVQEYISALVENDEALQIAAQDKEFETLVDQLQTVETCITQADIEGVDEYTDGGNSIIKNVWRLLQGR